MVKWFNMMLQFELFPVTRKEWTFTKCRENKSIYKTEYDSNRERAKFLSHIVIFIARCGWHENKSK